MAFRVAFTPTNTGSSSAVATLTVPSGVDPKDTVIFVALFITGTNITATFSTSGSGTATQLLGGSGFVLGTSAEGFLYEGTGFNPGDTITITPNVLNRNVASGVVYSEDYEQVSTAGSSSTTVANSPGVTTGNTSDTSVGVSCGITTTAGNTFSSLTAGWSAIPGTFIQGGSGTRFPMIQFNSLPMPAIGPTGNLVATAASTMLGSTGAQVVVIARRSLLVEERRARRNSLLRR